MKRSLLLLAGIILFRLTGASGQSFITADDELINGYSRKISGTDYEYHSCIPGLRQSILIRADSGRDFMEWETEAPQFRDNKKFAAFIWVAAIGSSPGNASMHLETDLKQNFIFNTDGKSDWTITSAEGSNLSFNSIMTDQYGDHHGYMVLRIPVNRLKKGIPLRIKVTGGKANLTSWYMTFKKEVKTGVELNPFPAILKKGNLQLVEAAIFYFGKETASKIYADKKIIASPVLKFGYNSVNIGLPEVKKPTAVKLKVIAGGFALEKTVILDPVRRWTIDLVQHSHTDIGYTRSQTEILAEHLRYIDYALDYCDATDNYPEDAKFRWTCEASWPVDEFLKCRPQAQIDRLMDRIREGRIEVTGMYFNFDEIPDEQILASSLAAAGRIKDRGIPVTLAMQDDVNGIGWCMNDYFNLLGIKYLNMGTHGHRALICFDKPTMFWWESPSGNRVLTFRAEHYMTGNTVFEIQNGDPDKFRNNLLNYLKNLEALKYPYNEIAIQHSGYLTDNSPPSTLASGMIMKWDQVFEWPKLTTSTAETFFKRMEEEHGNEFPVIRGAWPDWWTDGFGSAAREVAVTRKSAASLKANSAGLSMAAIAGIQLPEETESKIDLVNNALLFYTEHTTGYSESVREPFSQPTMEQRALKESYAWEADRRAASLGEDAMGLLQSMFRKEREPSLIVFNTLNWRRSGMTVIYIDHQIVPRGKKAGIFDRSGHQLAVQALSSRADGTYWAVWLEDVPEFGYRKYLIRPLDPDSITVSLKAPAFLENKWYRLVPDYTKGTIRSWSDKDLSLDLVDKESEYGMAEFILEQLGNRSQMESRKLVDFKRSPLDTVWFDSATDGPVFSSIRFNAETGTAIGPKGYSYEIRLYNTEKRVEIVCSITKKSIVDPESFYIAFPLSLKDGKHFTEVQGGVIETGKDQIKGSSNDWYTVQDFTAVRNTTAQVVMGCGEMPLMQFGAINTGRYQAGAMPQSTHIFSWPMNNYWVTNFNADQRGGHTWTYYLTSSDDISEGFASRFGWGSRVPWLTRILPGEGTGDNLSEGSFIKGWPENAILVSAQPLNDGKSVLIHLRETDGRETPVSLKNGLTGDLLRISASDVNGKPLQKDENILKPYESKFYLIYTDFRVSGK
jgi:Glycosyl hydrolases family 38 N-terminal domain